MNENLRYNWILSFRLDWSGQWSEGHVAVPWCMLCCSQALMYLAILFSFILILEHFGSQQRQGKMGKGEMLQGVMTLPGSYVL